MRKLLGLALLGLPLAGTAASGPALATAPLFGRWVANVPPKPFCSPSRLTLDVRGGSIAGTVVNDEGVFPVAGELDPYGNGTIRIGQVAGVVQFGRNHFVADYPNLRCGHRHAVGVRVG
jgi:hypothetical protein